ncbi:MAG: 5-(carboxyamino)imidazole ribonucleotide mutase [Candidatus Cloacimonas sp. 4484_209]|nr:MAG: 5-(carboxyamino)imidazole ribonucleotide mutase [Candidatus Cloacimonas sp. 4484_209]
MNKEVLIIMGSKSDEPVMAESKRILEQYNVAFDIMVSSAHRTPERTRKIAREAEKKGYKVIIAGAGYAAHLAGVVASETTLPVIGVPIASSPLKGIDALFSTIQMPGGVPVAGMGIGKSGAKNAALFAIEILALSNNSYRKKIEAMRKNWNTNLQ